MLHEGRILTNEWSKYQFQKNIVFKLKNLPEEEFLKNVKKVIKSYYSYPLITNRLSNAIKRGILTFHPLLFIMDNIFTRSYYSKLYREL